MVKIALTRSESQHFPLLDEQDMKRPKRRQPMTGSNTYNNKHQKYETNRVVTERRGRSRDLEYRH